MFRIFNLVKFYDVYPARLQGNLSRCYWLDGKLIPIPNLNTESVRVCLPTGPATGSFQTAAVT